MTYNFDVLKQIITGLASQNKSNDDTFKDLREKLEQKDRHIGNLEIKLVNSIRMLSEKLEDKTKDIEETVRLNTESNEEGQKSSLGKLEDTLSLLTKKVEKLESDDKKNKDRIKVLEDDLEDLKRSEIKTLKDTVKENSMNVTDLQEKDSIRETKMHKYDRSITDLYAKFSEVNIFEALKNNNSEGGGSGDRKDKDTYLLLIEGVKNSLTQKNEHLEQKLEIMQEILSKLKNDMIGAQRKIDISREKEADLSNKVDHINNQLHEIKIALNDLSLSGGHSNRNQMVKVEYNEKSNDNTNRNNTDTGGDYSGKIDELSNRLLIVEEELKSLSLGVPTKGDNKSTSTNTHTMTNINLNTADESQLRAKLIEIEKQIKVIHLKDKEREETNNKKFKAIEEALKKRVDKDAFQNWITEVNQLKDKLNEHKEEYYNTVEKGLVEDVNWAKKKIESLIFNVNDLKSMNKNVSREKDVDFVLGETMNTGKYLEIAIFNEYKSTVSKELNGLLSQIGDLWKLLEELQAALNTKANEKDLRTLEDMLLNKIEDFRQASVKKFADKADTNKNLRYLDINIKQLLETSMKRVEKGENWLIAKKPFGGNSCASCEAFLGDLNDHKEYVPWNKLKDSAERMYRLGNGFSKVLQDNVNFNFVSGANKQEGGGGAASLGNNVVISTSNNFGSTVNFNQNTSSSNMFNNEAKKKGGNDPLPKIRTKVKGNLNPSGGKAGAKLQSNQNNKTENNMGIVLNTQNISMEIPEFEENEEEMEVAGTEPKVLKIYKVKNKNFSNADSSQA
eukprot:CAMPEP_0170519332 /NCGR_PEP_ID=MMETSP0209-20121228/4789_1 /TAXON_ID=665100 ORGANISM="Litonotus pictus, Strain P1" /NCGR_SAMPLE_ID=MMETSP0209 /ASSEMBLY_ACC=CAM_ASM_000301 /LENGTH=787 /DNA_ID=CAMNT_0010805191 /DNA_START=87 /DNA_END=2450 /DNA_ORIENTATION=-